VPAGSKAFTLKPNVRAVVRVTLKPKFFKLLLKKKRLHVNVTISAADGLEGVNVDTTPLTLIAPQQSKLSTRRRR
jgi:hypothetical protein